MRKETRNAASKILMVGASVAVALSMAACTPGNGGTDEGGGSKTTQADRNTWTTVADTSGRVWCTIIKVTPAMGNDLDEGKLVDDLEGAKTYDWIRVICADNLETNKKEYAYVLLSTTSDYRQIKNAKDELEKAGWSCSMLDSHTYESYAQSADNGTYDFAETTYEK